MIYTTAKMYYFGSDIKNQNIITLIYNWILSQNLIYVIASFLYLFVWNPSVITIVYPLSLFLYALLDQPFPSTIFIKLILYYTVFITLIIFIVQIPIFCLNGGLIVNIFSSDKNYCNDTPPENVYLSWNFILGIFKFTGPGSYPQN